DSSPDLPPPPCPVDGVPCDDGDPTTIGDVCKGGTCVPGLQETCKKIDADIDCGDWDHWDLWTDDVHGATNAACDHDKMDWYDTIYRFVAPKTGTVDVWVSGYGGSSDTWVAYVLAGACNPAACMKWDFGFSVGLDFQAEAGRTYYIVVEGSSWDSYSLSVDCE
ncbi:MAG: hypothetical protein FJ087_19005, partial [Deltaproteobacteria bacterium]|nr:hypothetical protein [Deltaproteobacteria bacterium]